MLLRDGIMSQNEFPGLPEQAGNLYDLFQKITKDAVVGNDLFVSEFEQQRRYDMCQVCEHFSHAKKRCQKCGCFMSAKVKFKSASCPVNKW